MGGLLSSSNGSDSRQRSSARQRQIHSNSRKIVEQMGDGQETLLQQVIQKPRDINKPLYKKILRHPQTADWSQMPGGKEYVLVTLSQKSSQYKEVKNLFKATTKKHYAVIEIKRVQNPYLLGCYLLKKLEMEIIYGSVNEQIVFHGTKESNVAKICEDNFNWRMHGESAGSTYGQGVSFSPISYYSSHYSCQDTEVKVMFVVRMLLHEAVVGSGDMILPPQRGYGNKRYDTAAKENGHVLVKFSDNEFYPEYLIYYKGSPDSKNRNTMEKYTFYIIILVLIAYFLLSNDNIYEALLLHWK